MKVLVIPDVHLKPYMFQRAAELMHQGVADRAVCLMDIPDDWNQQYNIPLYEETFDSAISFAKEFPDTLWCMGNHDLSYVWQQPESGYSGLASNKIDNVVFCHGGIRDSFVKEHVSDSEYDDPDEAKITRKGNVISCDVFSTYRDGKPIGKREFLWIDTKTCEYHGVEY